MSDLKQEMEYIAKLGKLAALHLQIAVANMKPIEVYCKQMEVVHG